MKVNKKKLFYLYIIFVAVFIVIMGALIAYERYSGTSKLQQIKLENEFRYDAPEDISREDSSC